jgi:hypothetical protein
MGSFCLETIFGAFVLRLRHFARFKHALCRTGDRQIDHDACAGRMQVLRPDLAPMLLYDSIGDAQSQSGTFAGAFGGEEWVKSTVNIAESRAVVAEAQLHAIAVLSCLERQPSVRNLVQSFNGVVQYVEEYLLQ